MNLHDQMFQEFKDKTLLDQAKTYAYDYIDTVNDRNVGPSKKALENLKNFEESMPKQGIKGEAILEQLHLDGSPSSMAQIAGRYYGLVNGGVIPTALAARWLSDTWDQNVPLYASSPITSKLESVTEQWLQELFNLPKNTVASFLSGSSMAIICGLAAARYRLLKNKGWDINTQGLYGAPKLRIVAGEEAHGTVIKAISLLGFGTNSIEWVEADEEGRMKADALPSLDENTILILQAGNVNSGAFDPFSDILPKAKAAKAWVHIDGAFGLWAACSSTLAHLTSSIEDAHSFSLDGHKTLNTPYDNGILLCTDKEALVCALQAKGGYITYGEERDGMLYTPEMSRRARVVELWAALKYLGSEGIDTLVTSLHQRAVQFKEELEKNGFQVLNDVVFNQVVICGDNDDHTNKLIQFIQDSGECWVGGSTWKGKKVIRISVCSWATTKEDISRSTQAFIAAREACK